MNRLVCCLLLGLVLLAYSSIHHAEIHLKNAVIDTRSAPEAHPESLLERFTHLIDGLFGRAKISSVDDIKSHRTYLVQFDHVLVSHDESLDALKKLNILIGEYVPKNSYIVSASRQQIQLAKRVKGVSWVGHFHPHHKMHHKQLFQGHVDKHVEMSLKLSHLENKREERLTGRKLLDKPEDPERVEFVIIGQVAVHANREALEKSISEWKVQLVQILGDSFGNLIVASPKKIVLGVFGSKSAVKAADFLTKKGIIHWVEVKPPTRTHNKFSSMLTQSYSTPYAKPMWNRRINGDGQIIGIGDTGLDTFHCFFHDEVNPVPYQRTQTQNVVSKHRKINAFWEYMDRTDSVNGHGTHVSGIASGAPHPLLTPEPVKEYASLAFGSKLNFMDCGCDTDAGCSCPADTQCECDVKEGRLCQRKFGVVYLPLDLSDGYFPWFYNKGARVVSNSWGTGYYKDFSFGYSVSSQEIDQFAYEKGDFLPVFASGNSGGVFGYASLTSESEAKNALVVGASMSMLESFQTNTNFTDFSNILDHYRVELFQTYCSAGSLEYDKVLCEAAKQFDQAACCDDGGKCGTPSQRCCGVQRFPSVPGMSFRCCPTCINLEMTTHPTHYSPSNLAYFTARGPALDGRIKPDIIGVGDFILSSKSLGTEAANTCKLTQKPGDIMTKKEGTSMASPLVAAAAVLVRQFYQQGFYPSGNPTKSDEFAPSAALVKATLIHSARLLDGYIYLLSKHLWWNLVYKEGQRFQLTTPYMQGFGRIELNNALGVDSGLYIPNTIDRPIITNEVHQYCVSVSASNLPLRATLVWTDPASSPNARLHLVNDLDLIVIGPDSNVYYGNGKYSPIGTSRESPDFINNVEQFTWQGAPVGRYNFIVKGNSVPKGPQRYALIISGKIIQTVGCVDYSTIMQSSDLNRYVTLSYGFGMLAIIAIPALALLALYFFLQYRQVTTTSTGYKETYMKDSESGQPLFGDFKKEVELDDAPKEYTEFKDIDEKVSGIGGMNEVEQKELEEAKKNLLNQ